MFAVWYLYHNIYITEILLLLQIIPTTVAGQMKKSKSVQIVADAW